MTHVVAFLESLGRHGDPGPDAYAAAVAALDAAPLVREALLRRDTARLPQLLGASEPVCFILAPAEDAPAQDDKPAEPEPDEKPQARRYAAR
ncbi:MAG TPA: hypothetical protein VN259_10305 [Xanthomonadales bacterium]|nr:hypothetical protein [Xanthomonadales bacterium]